MTNKQFGVVGRVLTINNDCHHGVVKAKHNKGFVTGYVHGAAARTLVVGRDAMYRGTSMGGEAFARALGDSVTPDFPVVHRICPHCVPTHQNICYRRPAPPSDEFDLLNNRLLLRAVLPRRLAVNNQHSNWRWHPGPQPDVAFFVNKVNECVVGA